MKQKMNLYFLTTCALMAAVMCAAGPLSVPIGPVPVTLTNLVIYLAIMLLGGKGAAISVVVYLLLGAVGMPVFSSFQGGLAKLVGPTGGYLIGFLPMAWIAGVCMEKCNRKLIPTLLGMIAGTAVLYVLGTAWFVFQTQSAVSYALSVCVVPFVPFDLGKIVLGVVLGGILRTALEKAGLLKN